MCWSGEASAVLAVVGITTTAYAAYKKEPAPLWMALGYFSSMELLQAFTYPVIDQCSLPSNQIATLLSYLHIVFQPFFINMISMYFIPNAVREKIQWPVYTVCFASAIIMLLQLYPFEWAGSCALGEVMCAVRLMKFSERGRDRSLTGSGWSALAEEFGVALLFPGQKKANNAIGSFNWFKLGDSHRGGGEPLSIRQMITQVVDDHAIDPSQVFITGMSSGGAMTSVMLATYPEVFAGGAIIAGLPYRSANTLMQAMFRMNG